MSLTDNQKLAIETKDANILVSAAAGSGKTMVLTERIVGRIVSENDPVDVDRLLVMTFTNAAAAEMLDRIRDAIDKRLDALRHDPDAASETIVGLEKQSVLVHTAAITTIHGFCKKVISDHFEVVGLDPNFRVADENECRLIRQDALDECMEAAYEAADPDFLDAALCFSNAKNDTGIANLIIPIYEFIMANPEPESFAKECLKGYESGSFEEFTSSSVVKKFEEELLRKYNTAKKAADSAMELIEQYEDLLPYKANVEAYTDAFSRTGEEMEKAKCGIYDVLRQGLLGIKAPAFGKISDSKLSDDAILAKAEVKRLRDAAKDGVTKILAMMPFDIKTSYEHMRLMEPFIRAVVRTVLDFSRIYEKKKREKNIIDFNDMEHMAVSILKNPMIAGLYRERYVEIYVDEYQDSNMTQEMLVSLICRHDPGNVFQVGDVKQSIYRFRQARPDIFLAKYNTYKDDGGDRRILLNDNFRSRREVIDSVNEVFSKIMTEDLGGIRYGDDERLVCSADCYENSIPCEGDSYRTELILGESGEMSDEEFEANIVADRIMTMIREGFLVYDKREKITRPASFKDFVILVRSIKKYESVFRNVFTSAGIPLAVTGREGYFGTIEVQTALAFLSAVDNPLNDIPLAAVAKSPVGGFSDEELARITVASKEDEEKRCLYERIKAVAESGKDGDRTELADKCAIFIRLLRDYRVMSTYTPVYGILARFIDRHYSDFVKCMDKSEQRMANLSMLLSKAEDFGKTSFKGLYQFVRYMDQIRKYSIDDGEAQTVGEADDVVRLMTMHASKGLEFPVCFVTGVEKRRNAADESGGLIWSSNYGFGADFTDLERRVSGLTLPKILIKEDNRRESIAEEMRILYVAMTRAREKLILVGSDGPDGFSQVKAAENASSYLDMIKAAYDGRFDNIDIIYKTDEDLVNARFEDRMEEESATDELLAIVRSANREEGGLKEADSEVNANEIPDYLARVNEPYPYPINPKLRAKLSVSDLKHQAIEEEIARGLSLAPEGEKLFGETEPDKYIPKFMRGEGVSATGGTFYGTAFHRIMELWDYPEPGPSDGDVDNTRDNGKNESGRGQKVTEEAVREYVEKMYSLHRMDRQQADAINTEDVATFLNSPLGIRMREAKAAGMLFREQPFVIGIRQCEETVLVQGIIDAYFIEDEGITIVDYKTDRVDSPQMLMDRYRAQLEYYGLALSQITNKPVKALIIYSTRLRREILL